MIQIAQLNKKNKNTCVILLFVGCWANRAHHGFNPDEPSSKWAG